MTDRIRREHRFSVVPEPLTRDTRISDRAFRLWCILDRYAGASDASFPSRMTLAEALGCSRPSIDRAITELVDNGWLRKESRREAGLTNLYTLLDTGNAQVKAGGVITGDAPGGESPVTHPLITGDAPGGSPVSSGLITGDAQKEASPKDTSPEDAEREDASAAASATQEPTPISKRGTRLAEDWTPSEELRAWFRTATLGEDGPLLSMLVTTPWAETDKFKDYWRAKPGKDGSKLDWDATWRNWIRSAAQRVHERRGPASNVHRLPDSDSDRQARIGYFTPASGGN